ncbi:NTP transferase domain-containing protein [Edaphobacter aggregans]|uniref:phosphocholine cytidylyltransferase family protein n=1 Tax=Edaphobacter aggregans TaxID=570835 RepID=UPI000A07A381|nr:NTP transferase domain-containing protein [Edaphobacter aggregans]
MRKMGILRPPARRSTPRVNQCLILAAGNGSRLIKASGGSPKPLVQLHGRSLLEHVILGAKEAGIDRFVIVVGYGAGAMREWLTELQLGDVSINVVENLEYHKDNGVSVLKARNHIRDTFLLLMADHIFESRTAKALLEKPLAPGEVILAVDHKLDRIFDLDDATKVRRDGDSIVDIGKQIAKYDAYDTGMFLCSPALFDVLESVKKEGNCSLSDGMRMLGREGRLRAFDIEDGAWQDVDTPEALAYAESIFDQHFCRTAYAESYTNV